MRAKDETSTCQVANVRVGVDSDYLNGQSIFIRWNTAEPPPGAERPALAFLLDDNGNLFLMAVVQGLSCVTAWDEEGAVVRQKADPGVSETVHPARQEARSSNPADPTRHVLSGFPPPTARSSSRLGSLVNTIKSLLD